MSQQIQKGQQSLQSRWKSPVLWAAIVAQVLAILLTLGIIGPGLSDTVTQVVSTILQLLTILGVLNNPTDSKNP